MYHRVNDFDSDSLTTPTPIFEQMLAMLRAEYRVVGLQTIVKSITEGLTIQPRTVAITFDDGYRDNYDVAAPLLRKYELPATFFLTSGYIGTDRVFAWDKDNIHSHPLMTWDEVRELVRMGFEVGGHTVNHVNLGEIDEKLSTREIVECKKDIEGQIGKAITAFAYPFGRRDCIRPEIYPIISKAGFHCCCAGYGGKVQQKSDPMKLFRIPMYPSATELFMDIDGFMTFFDGKMSLNVGKIFQRGLSPLFAYANALLLFFRRK